MQDFAPNSGARNELWTKPYTQRTVQFNGTVRNITTMDTFGTVSLSHELNAAPTFVDPSLIKTNRKAFPGRRGASSVHIG